MTSFMDIRNSMEVDYNLFPMDYHGELTGNVTISILTTEMVDRTVAAIRSFGKYWGGTEADRNELIAQLERHKEILETLSSHQFSVNVDHDGDGITVLQEQS